MPDYGLVAAEELGPTTPQLAPLYPALPWEMPGARIIKLAFEVREQGRVVVADQVGAPHRADALGGRQLPFVPLDPRVGQQVLVAILLEHGVVDVLTDSDGQVSGVVAAPDGAPLATFSLMDIQGAEAERVVIDGELTARVPPRFSTADEEPVRLVQVNRAFALRDPTRAGFTVTFTSAGDRYPWGAVPVTNLIIAVDTRADLEYAPTEHVLDYFPPG